MSCTAAGIIAVAKGEVGYHEGRSSGHWNNIQKYSPAVPGLEWSQGQPWCATFADGWVPLQAGCSGLFPKTASCSTAVAWYKERGRFSFYPAVGAQVFFGAGGGSHTGLVYAYDADYAYTIEGNTNATGSAEGDGVYRKKRARRDSYVYGYGYPAYPGGIVSADPAWRDKAPAGGSDAFPGAGYFGSGAHNAYVTRLGQMLVARGGGRFYSEGPGPNWGEADRRATAAFQQAQGWSGSDADGIPGPDTWHLLVTGGGHDIPPAGSGRTVSLSRILAAARADIPAPTGHQTYPEGVQLVEQALVAEGLMSPTYASDGSWGTTTRDAYREWQRSAAGGGYRGAGADGYPGRDSLTRLGRRYGFTVVE